MGNDLLLTAFENFRKASGSLERVHRELSQKVMSLSRRLEEKNRELEQNLSEKEEIRSFLDAILSSMANGVLVLDRAGQVRTANRAFRQLMASGKTAEAEARPPRSFEMVPPALLTRLRKLLSDNERYDELEFGGKAVMVSVTRFRPSPEVDELFIFVFNDITELRQLQAEREQKARLTAMGEMAIQLAHEIRNPLGGVQLYASLLRAEHSNDDRESWLKNIDAGLAMINYMVTNMLRFYKPIRMSPDFVNPFEIIEESAAVLEPVSIRCGVSVRRNCDYSGEVIYADREMLKQLVMNLLKNAMNAMPEGGEISLSVLGPVDDPDGSGDPCCVLVCEDSGIGMDKGEMDRMFEPFWSSQTGGHGIGMWVCGQIVRQHHGKIQVQSRKGGGTKVLVHLPVHHSGDES